MRNTVNSGDGRLSGNGKLAFTGAVVSFAIGLAGLIGWIFRVPLLTSFHSDFIPIAPSTGLIMCAYGVLILDMVRNVPAPLFSRARVVVAYALTGISILLAITSVAGIYVPVEHLGIPIDGTFHLVPIGHISPISSIFFALTGIAAILLFSVSEIHTRAFRFAAVTVGFLTIVAVVLLVSYAAGGPLLYGTRIIPPALTTSVGFLGLVSGLSGVIACRVTSDRSSIQALRRTFPYRYVGAALLGTGLFLLAALIWFRQTAVEYQNAAGDGIAIPNSVMMGPLSRQLYVLAGFSILLLVLLALIGLFVWRSRAACYYQSLYSAQRSLHESEERYRTTLQSIGDAVIATDAEGHVEFMNTVAEDLTGWTLNDAAGRPVSDVFCVVDEAGGVPIDDPVQRVLRDRKIIKLSNPTELIARDDRKFPVTDTAAPIFSGSGEIQGVVLVFSDQTEERFRRTQLERSKERLRRIIDNMASGFVLHEIISDADGTPVDFRYLDFNAAFSEVTGIGRDAIGKRITEIFPDVREEPENWIDRIGGVGVSGIASRFEAYSRPFDRWISVIAYSPESGKVAAIVDDITQRRVVEQQLSFRSEIIEHVGDAVVVTDREGTILFWNNAATALYGWSVEEALGRSREELLPSEDLKSRLSEITNNLDARAFWSGEVLFVRKDGADVLVLLTVTPTCDETGQTTAVIAIGRDITARTTLEHRYAGLFQSITDAIVITNKDQEIVDCNGAFTSLFGYSLEDIIGVNADMIYETTGGQQQPETPLADFPGTSAVKRDIHFRRRDGTTFHGESTVSRLRDVDQNDLGYVQIIHDLSGRDLLHQELIAAQKMEALGLIAGGIAHDFNNVLTAINGAAQMLSIVVEEDSAKRYVDTVRSSVKRGISITTRMLTFIRSSDPDVVSLGLGSFLTEFVDVARHTLPKNVHARFQDIDDSHRVQVDPAQLQQVLFTLAINGAEAMPEGGEILFTLRRPNPEELREHLTATVDTEAYWCLDVSDAGVGMDRETQERIFEPFFTTKGTSRGTGIGLPVVETIVRLHRGWVSVRSEAGAGTTFTIALPSGSVPAPELTKDPTRLPDVVQGNNETLLIVEDEESIRIMLEEVFTTDGYRVFTADSAGTALDILTGSPDGVDLILTDIGLPDMNGKTLITKVRALLPEIPVIAMTGYVDEGLADSIYAVGANTVERKPYDIYKLSQEIARLLRGSHPNTEKDIYNGNADNQDV